MKVAIPVELEPFVQSVIGNGTYKTEAEVVGEALRILKKREQLRRDVDAGVEQLDRGQYSQYGEDSFGQFLEDVKAEERERFGDESCD